MKHLKHISTPKTALVDGDVDTIIGKIMRPILEMPLWQVFGKGDPAGDNNNNTY